MKHTYKKRKGCNDCQKMKPLSEFGERTGKQKGMLLAFCKSCMQIRQMKWRTEHHERYNEYQNKWRKANPQHRGEDCLCRKCNTCFHCGRYLLEKKNNECKHCI
jgi:hypothetical protein